MLKALALSLFFLACALLAVLAPVIFAMWG